MSNLKVFNSLTGQKEVFVPLNPPQVLIYACGPTVYDYSHLGHARMAIVWDVVQRYLRYSGYKVTFVRNITDVDDKIINRAKEFGIEPDQLAREFTYQFWHDMKALNVAIPEFEPRATQYIEAMIGFIAQLIDKGFAYASAGDVYFEVPKLKSYGQLKKQNLEDMQVGSREMVRSQDDLKEVKRNPLDFVLWKGAGQSETGWSSPWGKGRPGWHIECSTMIKHVLGETIDIHSGGEDLMFPHHENEIAQSQALHGKPLAKYWLHNSFVQLNEEKMSKSLGNFFTIQDLLKIYSGDNIRLLVLQTQYRNPIEFSTESLDATKAGLQRLISAAKLSSNYAAKTNEATLAITLLQAGCGDEFKAQGNEVLVKVQAEFKQAMDNDFNTAAALAVLFDLASTVIQEKNSQNQSLYADALIYYAQILGLTLQDNSQNLSEANSKELMDLILELRAKARIGKDYATSDLIRDKLNGLGIKVMDSVNACLWEKM
jgi:cysteinyl-tRNA synthetase